MALASADEPDGLYVDLTDRITRRLFPIPHDDETKHSSVLGRTIATDVFDVLEAHGLIDARPVPQAAGREVSAEAYKRGVRPVNWCAIEDARQERGR